MTLRQMSMLKRWHVLHRDRLPIEYQAWDAMLTLWLIGCIGVLLGVYTLHWAAAVAIPILLGLMFSYALSPVVDILERWRVPRALGAAVVVVAAIGGIGWTAWFFADDASQLVESLPEAAAK